MVSQKAQTYKEETTRNLQYRKQTLLPVDFLKVLLPPIPIPALLPISLRRHPLPFSPHGAAAAAGALGLLRARVHVGIERPRRGFQQAPDGGVPPPRGGVAVAAAAAAGRGGRALRGVAPAAAERGIGGPGERLRGEQRRRRRRRGAEGPPPRGRAGREPRAREHQLVLARRRRRSHRRRSMPLPRTSSRERGGGGGGGPEGGRGGGGGGGDDGEGGAMMMLMMMMIRAEQ